MSDKDSPQKVIEAHRKRQQMRQNTPVAVLVGAAILLIAGAAVIIFWLLGDSSPFKSATATPTLTSTPTTPDTATPLPATDTPTITPTSQPTETETPTITATTIAIANLIENAIKYSYSKSKIFLRSHLNIASGVDQARAVIEVDNIGFEILEEDRKRIFEGGERGGDKTRIKRIPGSGFGLWEARSIVEAHGGEIHVNFHPTAIHKHEGKATRVIFSIEIPLKQKR